MLQSSLKCNQPTRNSFGEKACNTYSDFRIYRPRSKTLQASKSVLEFWHVFKVSWLKPNWCRPFCQQMTNPLPPYLNLSDHFCLTSTWHPVTVTIFSCPQRFSIQAPRQLCDLSLRRFSLLAQRETLPTLQPFWTPRRKSLRVQDSWVFHGKVQ